MPEITIRLPDIGEGIAQAELVGWCVAIGDMVAEDDPLAEVMTDKATVEIPSAVTGRVVWLGGAVGDVLAVGCDLLRIAVDTAAHPTSMPAPFATPTEARQSAPVTTIAQPLTGLRRSIAQRMQAAALIPQFTIVDDVDVTRLETTRAALNDAHPTRPHLTVLPFLIKAMVKALAAHPDINAHLVQDGTAQLVQDAVHCGIATQTDAGLMVPVLRDAAGLDLWQIAAGIEHLATACRNGTVRREDLAGSTITVSSLGALGGIATTPLLNAPEVAVLGINRISVRPEWDGRAFQPRKMLNISCSFDHRVIDGWQAALFLSDLKTAVSEIGSDT